MIYAETNDLKPCFTLLSSPLTQPTYYSGAIWLLYGRPAPGDQPRGGGPSGCSSMRLKARR